MSGRLRVGVIGRGVWGCHSLEQQLRKRPGVEIAAVTAGPQWGAACFDDTEIAGREYAQELGAEYRDDWRAVACDPDIHILSLMTSPAARREPALAALATGMHVVVDKPLARTVEDARAIAHAERQSKGVGYMLCGYHTRPAVRFLRQSIDEGKLGALTHISVELYFTGGLIPGFTPSRTWIDGTMAVSYTHLRAHET